MSNDHYDLLGAKKLLIKQLKDKGISDPLVINAFEKVDRHLFLESYLWPRAYLDIAIGIDNDQTISQPYTVAFQSQLLQVKKGDRILEIGTGSGFQAAILDAMGARVFTIERHLELHRKAKTLLDQISSKIILEYGDGFLGFPEYAPYDKIIVTCGAPEIPPALVNQLKIGGIMVIPFGQNVQKMLKITKVDAQNILTEECGDFVFVPMLQEKERKN